MCGQTAQPSLKVCHGSEIDSERVIEKAHPPQGLQIQVPFAVLGCLMIVLLNYAVLIPGFVAESPFIGIKCGQIVLQLRGFG